MPCWSWDWQLCWAEIPHVEEPKTAWNFDLWTAGLQLCVLCGSIICFCGLLLLFAQTTLLSPSSLLHLPMGEHFVFFWQLHISTSIRHFNTLAHLYCFDTKIQKNCLCQCYTRTTKELLNEYNLNYRISTMFLQRCQIFSYFYIYMHIFAGILGQKIIKCSSFASITEETDTISLFSGYYSLLLCIEFN